MGILDFLYRRGKPLTEAQKLAIHGALSAESGRNLSEREDAALLGINLEMIRDEGLEKWLDKLAEVPMTLNESLTPNMDVLALRVMVSSLRRTSFMTLEDAEIAIIDNRRLFRRIEMRMKEREYEAGTANFLYALRLLIETAIYDSVRGRKALLMKAQTREIGVSVPEHQQKQQQRNW